MNRAAGGSFHRFLAKPIPIVALAIAVCGSYVGCAPSDDPAVAGAEQVDVAAEIEAIKIESLKLSEAYMAGDIAGLVNLYESDGIAAPGGRDFIVGHEDLTRLWALPEGRTILRHSATPVEIVVDGEHAYDRGYYEGQAAQDGVELDPFRGTYLIVWHKTDEGIWRIAVDMWHTL